MADIKTLINAQSGYSGWDYTTTPIAGSVVAAALNGATEAVTVTGTVNITGACAVTSEVEMNVTGRFVGDAASRATFYYPSPIPLYYPVKYVRAMSGGYVANCSGMVRSNSGGVVEDSNVFVLGPSDSIVGVTYRGCTFKPHALGNPLAEWFGYDGLMDSVNGAALMEVTDVSGSTVTATITQNFRRSTFEPFYPFSKANYVVIIGDAQGQYFTRTTSTNTTATAVGQSGTVTLSSDDFDVSDIAVGDILGAFDLSIGGTFEGCTFHVGLPDSGESWGIPAVFSLWGMCFGNTITGCTFLHDEDYDAGDGAGLAVGIGDYYCIFSSGTVLSEPYRHAWVNDCYYPNGYNTFTDNTFVGLPIPMLTMTLYNPHWSSGLTYAPDENGYTKRDTIGDPRYSEKGSVLHRGNVITGNDFGTTQAHLNFAADVVWRDNTTTPTETLIYKPGYGSAPSERDNPRQSGTENLLLAGAPTYNEWSEYGDEVYVTADALYDLADAFVWKAASGTVSVPATTSGATPLTTKLAAGAAAVSAIAAGDARPVPLASGTATALVTATGVTTVENVTADALYDLADAFVWKLAAGVVSFDVDTTGDALRVLLATGDALVTAGIVGDVTAEPLDGFAAGSVNANVGAYGAAVAVPLAAGVVTAPAGAVGDATLAGDPMAAGAVVAAFGATGAAYAVPLASGAVSVVVNGVGRVGEPPKPPYRLRVSGQDAARLRVTGSGNTRLKVTGADVVRLKVTGH